MTVAYTAGHGDKQVHPGIHSTQFMIRDPLDVSQPSVTIRRKISCEIVFGDIALWCDRGKLCGLCWCGIFE